MKVQNFRRRISRFVKILVSSSLVRVGIWENAKLNSILCFVHLKTKYVIRSFVLSNFLKHGLELYFIMLSLIKSKVE